MWVLTLAAGPGWKHGLFWGARAWVQGGAVGLQTGAQGYPIQSPSFRQMGSRGAKEGLTAYGFCLKCSRGTLQDVPRPYTFQPLSASVDTYIQMNPENQQFKLVLWTQPITFLSGDRRWPFSSSSPSTHLPLSLCPFYLVLSFLYLLGQPFLLSSDLTFTE